MLLCLKFLLEFEYEIIKTEKPKTCLYWFCVIPIFRIQKISTLILKPLRD